MIMKEKLYQTPSGEKDRAGSCIRYNKAWHRETGIPIRWIKGAGHNSNTDRPKTVNKIIEDFLTEMSFR